MQHIISRENDRVKYVRRLATSGRFRVQESLFFAEGTRLCLDLAAKSAPVTVFCTESLLEKRPSLATLGKECVIVSEGVAEKLAETRTPQGLFCLFELPKSKDLLYDKGLVLCEQVQDPGNVGAIVRSAAAFGYGGVVLVGGADPFSPRALRACMGSVLRVPVCCYDNLQEALKALDSARLCLCAAAADGEDLLCAQLQMPAPALLMLGNEGAGLSVQALALAQKTIRIPMQNEVESLNAAVAASVLMFALKQNR